ncbi:hypothetical protein Tco_1468160 [Tanacetum coccineum]
MPTEMELTLEQTQQGVSYEVLNIRVNSFTMKMEILLEPTSNKLMVEHAEFDESNTHVLERFDTSVGNPIKEILLKMNLLDHRSILMDSKAILDKAMRRSKDTMAIFEGRDEVMTDVILPPVQATRKLKILILSFSAPTQSPSHRIISSFQLLQPPILTPATTPRSIDVAVQLKYDKIREESHTENQQFLDSIDEGMKKVIKEQVKKEVSKITPKIEKLVNEQFESEVLVSISKEAKTSHLFRQSKAALPMHYRCYEADKILLRIPYMAISHINRPRDSTDEIKEPSVGTTGGPKEEGQERPKTTSAPRETTTTKAGKTTTAPAHQEFEKVSHDEQAEEEVYHLPDMFTRSVVIQRRMEDLQLGVESYQKKLNLTKPDTYRSNLRRRDAYTPYFDPRGFIYENKDKKNRLMRIDELHKFSNGTLDDVRTALYDRLKGIRMEYLPQTFWSQRDKANARAMIQAIDKRLKT